MAVFASDPIDVSAQVNYPATPQVTIPFRPKTIAITIEDKHESDPALMKGCVVSFDGVKNAAFMLAGNESGAWVWETQLYSVVYLKKYGDGGGATRIRVSAEG